MMRHTRGLVVLLFQTLMVIPSGPAWAQATGGATPEAAAEYILDELRRREII